jgi:DNA-binding transcriptional MerR regulator
VKEKSYTTKEIANITGVHPNTVRLYEAWGFISGARRLDNNYRAFTDLHLNQMRLARIALPGPYPINGKIVQQTVREFAMGNMEQSLALAGEYLEKVEQEQARALKALVILDDWFERKQGDKGKIILKSRKKAAAQLGLTVDTLRTWERNGLFKIQRNEDGVLCFSEWDLEKIEVIRLLRNCGYSIVSLLGVFNSQEKLKEKPSILLSLPDIDTDFFYVTDRFLQYLKQHIERAQIIIGMIRRII